MGRFLERRGPGLHHVAYRCDDVAGRAGAPGGRGRRAHRRRPAPGGPGAPRGLPPSPEHRRRARGARAASRLRPMERPPAAPGPAYRVAARRVPPAYRPAITFCRSTSSTSHCPSAGAHHHEGDVGHALARPPSGPRRSASPRSADPPPAPRARSCSPRARAPARWRPAGPPRRLLHAGVPAEPRPDLLEEAPERAARVPDRPVHRSEEPAHRLDVPLVGRLQEALQRQLGHHARAG